MRGTVTLAGRDRAPSSRDGALARRKRRSAGRPAVPDPRTEVVVVLERRESRAQEGGSCPPSTVELHGLRLDPRVLVVPVGANLVFKNGDRVPHTLFLENAASLFGPESQPAGQSRTVRLLAAAEYACAIRSIRTSRARWWPSRPRSCAGRREGRFKLDAPEGKYKLKVFWHGEWTR